MARATKSRRSRPTAPQGARRFRLPVAATLVIAFTIALAVPAGAETFAPVDPTAVAQAQVTALDAQIADARKAERGAERRLSGSSEVIARAERRLVTAQKAADLSGGPGLGRPLPGSATVGTPGRRAAAAARDRVTRAQAHLDAARSDPAYAAALKDVFAQQTAIADLEQQRTQVAGLAALVAAVDAGQQPQIVALTYDQWARMFLGMVGAPLCAENLVAVVAWQSAESTTAGWNPLATTYDGVTDWTLFNSAGVKNYATLADGLTATRETLRVGWDSYGYGWIVSSLQQCAPTLTTAKYINASSWCAGCAGGQYVTGLVPQVEADYTAYAARSAAS